MDRLRRPRQRVDRTCLLPVVRQRGSVVIVLCDIEPLSDLNVSIAVCNDWPLVSPTKWTSVRLSCAVTQILKNTLYRSDVEQNPDVYTSFIMPLKSWLEDQSPTLTATTFNGIFFFFFFFTTEMPDEWDLLHSEHEIVKIIKGKSRLYQQSQPVLRNSCMINVSWQVIFKYSNISNQINWCWENNCLNMCQYKVAHVHFKAQHVSGLLERNIY